MTMKCCVKSVNVESNNEKMMNAYKYFKPILIFRVLFGYNYELLSNNRCVSYLLKMYCIGLSFSICGFVMYNIQKYAIGPYNIAALEYAITVLISCFSNSSFRYDFFCNVDKLDVKLCIDKNYNYRKLKIIHKIIVIIAIIARAFYATSFCFCFNEICSYVNIATNCFISLAIDMNQIPLVIIFYMSYYQMKVLHINIEKKTVAKPTEIVINKNENNNIKNELEAYKDILNNMDNTLTKALNPLVNNLISVLRIKMIIKHLFMENILFQLFINILCSFPKIMLLIYNILVQSKNGVSLVTLSQLLNLISFISTI